MLVTGGFADGPALASAALYTPASNIWAPAADMPVARVVHTATLLLNGKVLVTGGNGLAVALNLGFTASFGPNLIFYLAARDTGEGNNTGWRSMGTWIAH